MHTQVFLYYVCACIFQYCPVIYVLFAVSCVQKGMYNKPFNLYMSQWAHGRSCKYIPNALLHFITQNDQTPIAKACIRLRDIVALFCSYRTTSSRHFHLWQPLKLCCLYNVYPKQTLRRCMGARAHRNAEPANQRNTSYIEREMIARQQIGYSKKRYV